MTKSNVFLLLALFLLLSFPLHAQTLKWQENVPGTSWLPDVVALFDNGTQAVNMRGSYGIAIHQYSTLEENAAPTPLSSHFTALGYSATNAVATSSRNDVVVTTNQVPVQVGSIQKYMPVMRVFKSGVLMYTKTFDNYLSWQKGYAYLSPFVSSDGSRIIMCIHDYENLGYRIFTFTHTSSVHVTESFISMTGLASSFHMSDDGKRLAFISSNKLKIVNLVLGALVFDTTFLGEYSYNDTGADFSGDGAIFAYGTKEKIRMVKENLAGVYSLSTPLPLPINNYSTTVAISEDGSTLISGGSEFGVQNKAYLRAFDLNTSEILFEKTYLGQAASDLQNIPDFSSVSTDGKILGVAMWGDVLSSNGIATGSPEIAILKRDGTPVLELNLPGSPMAFDMDPEGRGIVIGVKGIHAATLGGGGDVRAYSLDNLTDVNVIGIPAIGGQVVVEVKTDKPQAQLLIADALEAMPLQTSWGTLFLERESLTISSPQVTDSNQIARFTVNIPNNPALIGATQFIQGIGAPRKLTDFWQMFRVLPAMP